MVNKYKYQILYFFYLFDNTLRHLLWTKYLICTYIAGLSMLFPVAYFWESKIVFWRIFLYFRFKDFSAILVFQLTKVLTQLTLWFAPLLWHFFPSLLWFDPLLWCFDPFVFFGFRSVTEQYLLSMGASKTCMVFVSQFFQNTLVSFVWDCLFYWLMECCWWNLIIKLF